MKKSDLGSATEEDTQLNLHVRSTFLDMSWSATSGNLSHKVLELQCAVTQLRHISKQPHRNCFQQIPTSLRSQPFRYRQGPYCAPYLRYKWHSWKKCCLLWLWRLSPKLNVWVNTLCNIFHFFLLQRVTLWRARPRISYRSVLYVTTDNRTYRSYAVCYRKKLRCKLNALLRLLKLNNFINKPSHARLWHFIIQFLGSIIQKEIFL
jgi:hypothetical protein